MNTIYTDSHGQRLIAVVSAAICLAMAPTLHAADNKDPRAVKIAESMMKAMGGQDAWKTARYLRFDFKVTDGGNVRVDRSHMLDRSTGKYRLQGKTKEGKTSVVLMNMADKTGSAFVDGKKLEGSEAKKAIDDAYGAYINDYYWLAMPWKWMDTGVNLKYLGKRKAGSEDCDVVQLTFGQVGLTPGDRYQAFVSPQSNLMTHWEYTLQSGNKGSWDWEYTTTKGIMLAKNHTNEKGTSINMGDPKFLDSVDAAVFSDPAKPMP